MAKPLFSAVKGVNDLLPGDVARWEYVEQAAAKVLNGFGYSQLRLPLLEQYSLFCRSIGEVTDIVEKEMYVFGDAENKKIALRPEGTAGCVRAAIQNGLVYEGAQRVWYDGPMFRRERPQKGRYRQFHQIGVETFGIETADIDAELILLAATLWQELGITGLRLELNSLGTPESRQAYRSLLVEYFSAHKDKLDEDSKRRLERNPLRILDSKNPELRELIAEAPSILDYLDDESAEHFQRLRAILDASGISYEINPRLVRGLDYYSRTVFEWKTDQLGAQDAVCSGGRYDGLVEQLGGRATPASGFALGMERLIALLPEQEWNSATADVYIVVGGDAAGIEAPKLASQLRQALPERSIVVHTGGGSFKSQLRKADRSGAGVALVLADDELANATATVKPLRGQGEQETVAQSVLAERLHELFSN